MLDTYCERSGFAGLWAEPINAATNLAFIVAALLAARQFRQQPGLTLRNGWDLALLILLLAAIGIGSGLWHTFATRWAVLADVIPITLLINLYLLSIGVRALRLRPLGLLGLWLSYQAVSIGLVTLTGPTALHGSIGYLPALLFLIGLAVWLGARVGPPAAGLAKTLGVAAALFAVSLTLRTLDGALCHWLPIGTHFLWHLLNALLLYLLLTGLIRHGNGQSARAAPNPVAGP